MSELTLVYDEDGVMAWNGDHDVQVVAELRTDGLWEVAAYCDGNLLAEVSEPKAQDELAKATRACYLGAKRALRSC